MKTNRDFQMSEAASGARCRWSRSGVHAHAPPLIPVSSHAIDSPSSQARDVQLIQSKMCERHCRIMPEHSSTIDVTSNEFVRKSGRSPTRSMVDVRFLPKTSLGSGAQLRPSQESQSPLQEISTQTRPRRSVNPPIELSAVPGNCTYLVLT